LKNWCRRVAVNVWFDRQRKKRLRFAPLPEDVVDPHEGNPDAALLAEEESVLLAAALERLKPHRRMVLELRFFGGLKCAEVARQMGHTEEWVRITSMRACADLKRVCGRQP
jgi:RNA polymerase sigma factor (sigma-70 family)